MTPLRAISVLLVLGSCWGLTMPMTKIAVSTGHKHFGLIFWQLVIVSLVLFGVLWWRGERVRFSRRWIGTLVVIALLGTIIPDSASYIAAAQLPSGVMSIVMSMVPMSALPIALMWGAERFQWKRLSGLVLGALAVMLIIGQDTSLPDPTKAIFVLIAISATVCYGFEGNYVARFGLAGMSPTETILYSSLVGLVLVTPLAFGTGQWFPIWQTFGAPEGAFVVSSLCHAVAYVGYLWLVGAAGPVFAAALVARGDSPARTRANISALAAGIIAFSVISFWAFGLITRDIIVYAAFASPAILAGVWVGAVMFRRLHGVNLRMVILCFLALIAIFTLYDTLV